MEVEAKEGEGAPPYEAASWASLATWWWMTPLVHRGRRAAAPLQVSDVPALAPSEGPHATHQLFCAQWDRGGGRNRVQRALLRAFWPLLLLNALLALLRAVVVFTGPLLIQSFVKLKSTPSDGGKHHPWEGLRLVLALLVSMVANAFFSSHYSFHGARLGVKIRGALITALYRKGLRLSCSARKEHAGAIVNYMAVDTQQVCDLMPLVHYLWVMPLQVVVAVGLLYKYFGVKPTASVLAGVIVIAAFFLLGARSKNRYQEMMMAEGDQRLKAMAEVLSYMRVIKLQAWEGYFEERINRFRRLEFGSITRFNYLTCGNVIVIWSAPALISLLLLGTCVLCGVRLDAGLVFTAMSLLQILQEPLRYFPRVMNQTSQALISLRRLNSYMSSMELNRGAVVRESVAATTLSLDDGGIGMAVQVDAASFSWDDDVVDARQEVLRALTLGIRTGTLAMVVGMVGSGKSSLLACILGEMRKLCGTVTVRGTIAYVAQTAWIQSGTIMDNILFGLPMNKERYNEVIRVCCLDKDLEMLEFGDKTEIGERGINLSGGQKQRIQLARAVYQDCDVYLLDDIFSAVDASTGAEMFKECVTGALKDRTVVLVTHQIDFLHSADNIYVMNDGMIVQSGRYGEILQQSSDFAALIAAHKSSMELVETAVLGPEKRKYDDDAGPSSKPSNVEVEPDTAIVEVEANSQKTPGQLINDEERACGHVSLGVYKQYMTEVWGWWAPLAVVLLSVLWQGCAVGSDYWVAYGTSGEKAVQPSWFIQMYTVMTAMLVVIMTARSVLIAFVGLKTANNFFKKILCSIVHAPMSFFDTTPSGRVLSRASSDQKTLDLVLPFNLWMCLPTYVTLISVLIVTCLVAWPSVVATIPLLALNLWYMSYYLPTSRELTRLESITNAPVIQQFSETLQGVMTIRSFRKEGTFFKENLDLVKSSLTMNFHNNGANQWFIFRMELLGSIFLCITTLLMVTLPTRFINPKLVGLSLSYGLSLNSTLFMAILTTCFVENKMVSVERIKQFINIPCEAKWRIDDCLDDENWPTSGGIDLIDLKVRYTPNGSLVLKGITISINGGEKIGVVGRTGSGKSTLIQTLFRTVEPSEGKIIVDGIDICTLGLHDLRSRFGIIPQEAVLFEGTIRSNIDPLQKYSDDEIWQALDRCGLRDAVTSQPEKLDTSVVDNGENWSIGQRQLLCLGRVMMKHSKILFMDEATASVDSQTDAAIQKIIREEFAACTVICIAHRIPTVMDCDRVLVIDAGLAKEFDRPKNLLEIPSLFRALAQEYTNRSSTDVRDYNVIKPKMVLEEDGLTPDDQFLRYVNLFQGPLNDSAVMAMTALCGLNDTTGTAAVHD